MSKKNSFFKKYVVAILLFMIGTWAGPVFYQTVLTGSFIPTFQVPAFLQQICFGMVTGLAGVLVVQLDKGKNPVEMRKPGFFLLFLILILAGAFTGKAFIPEYSTIFSDGSGSGYYIDFRLFNKAVVILTICMVLFVMIGFAFALKVLKLKSRQV